MASGIKFDIKVEGMQDVLATLKLLPQKIQGKPMRAALRSGAGITRRKAANTTAWYSHSGFLRESIVTYGVKKNEHEYTEQVRVGVLRRRRKKPGKKLAAAMQTRRRRTTKNIVTPYYWQYLEFGTSRMAARPFLRPAFESTKNAALQRIKLRLRTEIEKTALKLAKKAAK